LDKCLRGIAVNGDVITVGAAENAPGSTAPEEAAKKFSEDLGVGSRQTRVTELSAT